MVRLHGVPQVLISDRDPRFTSTFWRALCSRLGTRLAMSSAFHPQSDGKTERLNAVVEEILRCYVSARQDDWVSHLALVEFAINASQHTSTGMSPFMANYGFQPQAPWEVAPHEPPLRHADAAAFVAEMAQVHEFCRDALQRAKAKQANVLNARRRPVTFNVGDQVLLSTQHLNLHLPGVKLGPRFIGPLRVLACVGPNAVKLELPLALGLRNHDVFNVDKVRPYYPRPAAWSATAKKPQPLQPGGDVWPVEAVLAKKKQGSSWYYLVVWRDCGLEQASWEPEAHVPPWTRALLDNRFPADGDAADLNA